MDGHLRSPLLFPWKLFKRIFFLISIRVCFLFKAPVFVFVSKVCSQMPGSLIQIKQVTNCFHNSERTDHGSWLMEASGTEVLLEALTLLLIFSDKQALQGDKRNQRLLFEPCSFEVGQCGSL